MELLIIGLAGMALYSVLKNRSNTQLQQQSQVQDKTQQQAQNQTQAQSQSQSQQQAQSQSQQQSQSQSQQQKQNQNQQQSQTQTQAQSQSQSQTQSQNKQQNFSNLDEKIKLYNETWLSINVSGYRTSNTFLITSENDGIYMISKGQIDSRLIYKNNQKINSVLDIYKNNKEFGAIYENSQISKFEKENWKDIFNSLSSMYAWNIVENLDQRKIAEANFIRLKNMYMTLFTRIDAIYRVTAFMGLPFQSGKIPLITSGMNLMILRIKNNKIVTIEIPMMTINGKKETNFRNFYVSNFEKMQSNAKNKHYKYMIYENFRNNSVYSGSILDKIRENILGGAFALNLNQIKDMLSNDFKTNFDDALPVSYSGIIDFSIAIAYHARIALMERINKTPTEDYNSMKESDEKFARDVVNSMLLI